jgi:hypothetical protein
MMAKYIIEAVKTIYLSAEVEASSLEEAEAIERELIIDDFDEVNTDIRIESITEKEGK